MDSSALEWFAVIGAFVAAGAALYTAWETRGQVKALKTSLQIESGLKFNERFDAPGFQTKRKAAATAVLAQIKSRKAAVEVEDVFDFFDELAFLVRKGALDEEMVWHGFYHWIRMYMQGAEEYIATRTAEEPRVWEDLKWIYPHLNALEAARHPEKYCEKLTDEKLRQFLEEEISG